MRINHAIDILSRYSRWRKGVYSRPPSPQEFGEAVDVVLDSLMAKKKIKKEDTT
jgi:hypothetical protein